MMKMAARSENDYDGIYDRSDSCPGTDFTAGPDGVADTGDEPPDSQGLPVQTREDQDYVLDADGCYDARARTTTEMGSRMTSRPFQSVPTRRTSAASTLGLSTSTTTLTRTLVT